MEQVDINQVPTKKSGINVKVVAVLGVVILAVVIVAVVLFTSGTIGGSGMSGKYYSTYYGLSGETDYIEFSGRNTIKFYDYGTLMGQGTYELTEDELGIQITLGAEGVKDTVKMTGTVSAGKTTIIINGESYVKR